MAELQLAKLKRTEITESEMAECNDVERKVWKLWFCKICREIKRIGKNVLKFEGQDLILDLLASGKHFAITMREEDEKESFKDKNGEEIFDSSVKVGRIAEELLDLIQLI